MSSRLVVAGLALGCLTAAAGGSYLAVRQNAAVAVPTESAAPVPPVQPVSSGTAVAETEAVVTPHLSAEPRRASPAAVERPEPVRPAAPRRARQRASEQPVIAAAHDPAAADVAAPAVEVPPTGAAVPAPAPEPERPVGHPTAAAPEVSASRPAAPIIDQITIPASAVIGLDIERTITSEQARPEDRVEARVTRDVYAEGHLAVPAGSRALGNVTLVERGGKVKERARLGVRFHTLVLADGRQVPIRTETVLREGESPVAGSSRKIGGAAIGGAVLGALLGGGKGAVAGAAAGAAGGTAAVMAGGRQAATLAGGSVVTIRLTAPATVEIER